MRTASLASEQRDSFCYYEAQKRAQPGFKPQNESHGPDNRTLKRLHPGCALYWSLPMAATNLEKSIVGVLLNVVLQCRPSNSDTQLAQNLLAAFARPVPSDQETATRNPVSIDKLSATR